MPDGEKVFTDTDVEMLRTACRYIEAGVADEEVVIQLTRVVGSSMARVAEAQLSVLEERMAIAQLAGDEAVEVALALINVLRDVWGQLFTYAHERHVQAAARRASFIQEEATGTANVMAVGFADLVGFTVLSQQLDARDLAAVVDRFEAISYDTIASFGGRVVKMIGDEVMFVADDPAAAARLGLALSERYGDEEALSDVRVGLAYGPVLPHEGDYFGPVVNLASRIVNIAYAGSVVVSDELYNVLQGNEEFGWKPLRPRRLKGIGLTTLWAITRPEEGRPVVTEVARRVRAHRNKGRGRRAANS
jgi:adenylate cyclase